MTLNSIQRNLMRKIWLLTLIVLTVGSCHRTDKAEQLAALDDAYKSGVITKDEYEAKKSALFPAAPIVPPAPVKAEPAPAPVVDVARIEPPKAESPKSDKMAPPPKQATKAAKEAAPIAKVQPPPPSPKNSPLPAPEPPPAPPVVAPEPSPAPTPKADEVSKASEPESEPAPLAGCEDAEYKRSNEKAVQERFFPMSEVVVHKAALSALESLDFVVHKDSPAEIEASKKRHASAIVGAGGERVILRFARNRKENREGTLIKAETKKTFVGRLGQRSWTSAVLAQAACLLR
jgi:hypothetical protein